LVDRVLVSLEILAKKIDRLLLAHSNIRWMHIVYSSKKVYAMTSQYNV